MNDNFCVYIWCPDIWSKYHPVMSDLFRMFVPAEQSKSHGHAAEYADLDDDLKQHIDNCKFRKAEGMSELKYLCGLQKSPDFREPPSEELGVALCAILENDQAHDSFKEVIRTGLMNGCYIRTLHEVKETLMIVSRLYVVVDGEWYILCETTY